ncbi:phage holin, LLH family [Filifactor alocis]
MKKEYFELITIVLKVLLLAMSIWVVPQAKKYIESSTTKEQRENALFWIKQVTRIAEEVYKSKGAGEVKKQWVIEWLDKNGIKLSEEQLSVLIDMVVAEYNKNGWNLTK